MTTMTAATGMVLWFDLARDFGFLRPDIAGASDTFLHGNAVRQAGVRPTALKPGQEVAFRIEIGKSGRPQARDLKLVAA